MKKNIKSKGYSVLLSCLSICAVPAQQLVPSIVQKKSSNLGTDAIGRFFNDQFFKLNINNNKNVFKTEVSPKIYETKSNLHPGLPPAIVEDESRSCEITKINISESDIFDTNRFVPVINLKFSTTSDAEDYFDSSKNNPSTLQQIAKSNILPSDGAGIQLMIYDKLKNDLADLCIYEKNELIARRDFEIVSKNNTSPITKTPFCFKVGIEEDGFLFCDAQLKNSLGYNINVKFKLSIKSTDISLKFIDTTKDQFKHFELDSNITNQNIFNETTCSISRGNTSDNFNLRIQETGKISSDLTVSSLNNISSLDCPPVSSISFDEKFLESSVYSGNTYLDIPIEHIIIRQING